MVYIFRASSLEIASEGSTIFPRSVVRVTIDQMARKGLYGFIEVLGPSLTMWSEPPQTTIPAATIERKGLNVFMRSSPSIYFMASASL